MQGRLPRRRWRRGAIIYVARRYVNSGGDASTGGFTLHDLRQLHKAGEISDDEFTRAKAQMIGRIAADDEAESASQPDASPGNPPEVEQ
jgi:hypothetical protein